MLAALNKQRVFMFAVALSACFQANADEKIDKMSMDEMKMQADLNEAQAKALKSSLKVKQAKMANDLFDIQQKVQLRNLKRTLKEKGFDSHDTQRESIRPSKPLLKGKPLPPPDSVRGSGEYTVVAITGERKDGLVASLKNEKGQTSSVSKGTVLPDGTKVIHITPLNVIIQFGNGDTQVLPLSLGG